MLPVGEYMDHHPTPQVAGEMGRRKKNAPRGIEEKKKRL